jgi:hypothetical protein
MFWVVTNICGGRLEDFEVVISCQDRWTALVVRWRWCLFENADSSHVSTLLSHRYASHEMS